MASFIKKYTNQILVTTAIIFLLVGITLPFYVKWKCKDHTFVGLGTIGDWFGGIANPFIGLASFVIVYLAFKLQKDNNKSQQDQIDTQNTNLNLQRFEATFFQLLTFHHEIARSLTTPVKIKSVQTRQTNLPKNEINGEKELEGLNITETTNTYDSKNFFYLSIEILTEYYKTETNKLNSSNLNLESKKTAMLYSFNKFYKENESSLGHYFRNLYHITKYIHNSTLINNDEKKTYIGIFRAQLSAYELVLLLYNCSVEDLGYPKFRKLVIAHSILKNMNSNLLLDTDHLTIFHRLE